MSRTRAVKVDTKIGIVATLKMVAQANDAGYGVPGAIIYGCLTRKEVKYVCASGLLEERDSAYMRHMGAGNMFYITEAGRAFLQGQ